MAKLKKKQQTTWTIILEYNWKLLFLVPGGSLTWNWIMAIEGHLIKTVQYLQYITSPQMDLKSVKMLIV